MPECRATGVVCCHLECRNCRCRCLQITKFEQFVVVWEQIVNHLEEIRWLRRSQAFTSHILPNILPVCFTVLIFFLRGNQSAKTSLRISAVSDGSFFSPSPAKSWLCTWPHPKPLPPNPTPPLTSVHSWLPSQQLIGLLPLPWLTSPRHHGALYLPHHALPCPTIIHSISSSDGLQWYVLDCQNQSWPTMSMGWIVSKSLGKIEQIHSYERREWKITYVLV